MPVITIPSVLNRFEKKTDTQSKVIHMISKHVMNGTGPSFSVKSKTPDDVMKVLMSHTRWNMVFVGDIPMSDVNDSDMWMVWSDIFQIAAETELGIENTLKLNSIKLTPCGILIQWGMNESWTGKRSVFKKRFNKKMNILYQKFKEYSTWGDVKVEPVIINNN